MPNDLRNRVEAGVARNFNPALFFSFALGALVAGSTSLRAQEKAPLKEGWMHAEDAAKPSPEAGSEVIITDDGYELTLAPDGKGSYVELSRRKLSRAELPAWHPLHKSRAHPAVYILGVLAAVGFPSLLFFLKYRHDKRAIIREIQRRQGSVEDVRIRIGLVNTEWEVTYLDEQGVRRYGTCCVQRGWGWSVYWKNQGPSTEAVHSEEKLEGPRVAAIAIGGGKKRCGGCGAIVNVYAVRCHQCKAVFIEDAGEDRA